MKIFVLAWIFAMLGCVAVLMSSTPKHAVNHSFISLNGWLTGFEQLHSIFKFVARTFFLFENRVGRTRLLQEGDFDVRCVQCRGVPGLVAHVLSAYINCACERSGSYAGTVKH